jgi:hypothetical protein
LFLASFADFEMGPMDIWMLALVLCSSLRMEASTCSSEGSLVSSTFALQKTLLKWVEMVECGSHPDLLLRPIEYLVVY